MATFDKINISLAATGLVAVMVGSEVMASPVAPILKVALATVNIWSWLW